MNFLATLDRLESQKYVPPLIPQEKYRDTPCVSYVCMYVCMYVCLYMYVFMHACMYVCRPVCTLSVIKLKHFFQFESFQINHCHSNTYIALKM